MRLTLPENPNVLMILVFGALFALLGLYMVRYAFINWHSPFHRQDPEVTKALDATERLLNESRQHRLILDERRNIHKELHALAMDTPLTTQQKAEWDSLMLRDDSLSVEARSISGKWRVEPESSLREAAPDQPKR